jgi:hypothetical protein
LRRLPTSLRPHNLAWANVFAGRRALSALYRSIMSATSSIPALLPYC